MKHIILIVSLLMGVTLGVQAVSYTHLDVYKRQVLVILIKTYEVFKHLFRFFVKEDFVRTKRL